MATVSTNKAAKVIPLKNTRPETTGNSKFNSSLQCGDCLHYKGQKHPKFDAPCGTLGIGSKAEAPSCYTPDVTAFKSMSKDSFPYIAALVGAMSPRQARVLMGMLKYAGSLERIGMTFMQEVYFCMSSEQEAYLDDYYRGYVIGLNKAGGVIIVGTDYLQGSKNSMIAYLDKSSVLTETQFNNRRRGLVNQGKIRKPMILRLEKKNKYIVPTIDEAPPEQRRNPPPHVQLSGAPSRKMGKGSLTVSQG